MTETESRREGFSVLGALESLVRHRRMIVVNVGTVVALAVILSLVLPKHYRSTAVILPPETPIDPLTTLGALQMAAATANLPWFATTADVYAAVLRSRNTSERIIDRFDLMRLYDVDTVEKAVKRLAKRRWVRVTDENLIELTVEDRDPVRAAEMANAFFAVLDEFNRDTRMTEGKRTLAFVEERMAQTGRELADAESALRDFQKAHAAVELTGQTEALIEAAAEIESQILALDVRLATLGSYATADHPEIQILRTQKDDLHRHLTELLGKADLGGVSGTGYESLPFPSLDRVPDLGMQYMRLRREVEIKAKVQAFLAQELERSKIMASRDTPTIQQLDTACPPDKKYRPKRTLIVFIAFLASLFGSAALAFGMDAATRWKENDDSYRRASRILGVLREDWRGSRRKRVPRE